MSGGQVQNQRGDYSLAERQILRLDTPHRLLATPNRIIDFLEEGQIEGGAFSQVTKTTNISTYFAEGNLEARAKNFLERYAFNSLDNFRSELAGIKRIGDIGAGPGVLSLWLRKTFQECEMVCLDNSSLLLEFCSFCGYLENTIMVLSDMSLPLPMVDKCLDFVVCDYVLSHVVDAEYSLAEVFRVLAPKGRLAVSFSLRQAPIRELSDGYLRQAFASNGTEGRYELATELTQLAQELDAQTSEVKFAKDFPRLGIRSGSYSLQRFVYHFFLKCFWNGNWEYSLSRNSNNFLYPWRLFEEEEALKLVKKYGTILRFKNDKSTLSVLAEKVA